VSEHILLDLDHTLYPPSTGLMDEMNRRIESYTASFLKVSLPESERIRATLRDRHGTTLRGLFLEHGDDPERFLAFVHQGLPGDFLKNDPALDAALAALGKKVHIFTNAPENYARRALSALGVAQRFDRVFDIAFTKYLGKPALEAYRMVETALSCGPSSCLLVDDTLSNVRGALSAGWKAVWLTERADEGGIRKVASLSLLPDLLRQAVGGR